MFLVVAIAGGLAGAIGLSVLAALVSAALDPDTFGEQQFVVGFAFTIVLGMMLGSTTTLAVHLSRRGHRTGAGWIAAAGGPAILILAASIAWGSAFSGDGGTVEFVYMLDSPWVAPSLLGGAALLIWGSSRLLSARHVRR